MWAKDNHSLGEEGSMDTNHAARTTDDAPPANLHRTTGTKKIKTLIVDDEPLARERLAALLGQEGDIEVVAQARDGEEAVTAIQDHAPQLVFLDVQMPHINGF